MKIKTNELTGPALDWAVAKAEEWPMDVWYDEDQMPMIRDDEVPEWKPSTDWSQGGPLIEREWIEVVPWPNESDEDLRWRATQHDTLARVSCTGSTALIAAMRCFVASRLGEEVEVPDDMEN